MKMDNIQKSSAMTVITCTGNYRKSKFFNIVNIIADFFNDKPNYKIFLSNEYLSKDINPDLSNNIISCLLC